MCGNDISKATSAVDSAVSKAIGGELGNAYSTSVPALHDQSAQLLGFKDKTWSKEGWNLTNNPWLKGVDEMFGEITGRNAGRKEIFNHFLRRGP